MKIKYSGRTGRLVKQRLSTSIINAVEKSPALVKEVSKIFQQANRRIQNVASTGLYSPAVQALNKQNISGYSKFSIKGKSWSELKLEYAKAVNFLNQPTSTASGTREYNRNIQTKYNLNDEQYSILTEQYLSKLNSIDYGGLLLANYSQVGTYFENTARDVSAQIESESSSLIAEIEADIEKVAQKAAQEIVNALDNIEGWIDL